MVPSLCMAPRDSRRSVSRSGCGHLRCGTGTRAGRRARARRRRVGGGCGCGTRVGAVEAGTVERDADVAEDLAQGARAFGALGERVVGEVLADVEGVSAFGATVGIGGHWWSSIRAGSVVTRGRRW